MVTMTYFIRDKNMANVSTYITCTTGATEADARQQALSACADDWDVSVDELWVQGVAVGDVVIHDWDDERVWE